MVVAETETVSRAEAESSLDHQNPKNGGHPNGGHGSYAFQNLGRQSSIYSLTLDEFQNTLCEGGKNFGSMNMDEFLNSIWTAEENQAHHGQAGQDHVHVSSSSAQLASAGHHSSGRGVISTQPSLPRQGSLSLPAPLCGKTVDEVWSEIQRTHDKQQQQQQQEEEAQHTRQQSVTGSGGTTTTQRQATFAEMTLEDFLIKAGVVREQSGPGPGPASGPQPVAVMPPPPPAQQHSQYGFAGPHAQMGPPFMARPMMAAAYPGVPVSGGEGSGYGSKRSNGYVAPSVPCYGARVNNGGAPAGGGFGVGLSPVSPVSPDAVCGPGQVDNLSAHYGMDMAVLRGRKRTIDSPVEKVVERRQRRMIKNRESAARSRARKQAYTVEMEAELNQLREENAQLKQALAGLERQRKQQYLEEQKQYALTRAQRAQDKLKAMRRSRSCSL